MLLVLNILFWSGPNHAFHFHNKRSNSQLQTGSGNNITKQSEQKMTDVIGKQQCRTLHSEADQCFIQISVISRSFWKHSELIASNFKHNPNKRLCGVLKLHQNDLWCK